MCTHVFVYGTLKRGFANYKRFCRGAVSAEKATICGRLYELPAGFPALRVPEEAVCAVGSADPASDARLQRRFNASGVGLASGVLGWGSVGGDLFAFDDPEARLPAIDRLEGFDPEGYSLYRRVLVPVEPEGGNTVLAWAYAMERPGGVYLPGGVWPL